jgi:hypothetical protein
MRQRTIQIQNPPHKLEFSLLAPNPADGTHQPSIDLMQVLGHEDGSASYYRRCNPFKCLALADRLHKNLLTQKEQIARDTQNEYLRT